MATFDLEEQEQLAQLKALWERYGTIITVALTLLACGIAGYRGWNYFQDKKAAEAAALYATVVKTAQENKFDEGKAAVDQLIEHYSRTSYSSRAALLLAKQQFEKKDWDGAKKSLLWAAEHADEEFLKALARYRLAIVWLEENKYDEALNALGNRYPESMNVLFEDLRGDILHAAGRNSEAITAYRTALEKSDEKSTYKEQLQIKIASLESELGIAVTPMGALNEASPKDQNSTPPNSPGLKK